MSGDLQSAVIGAVAALAGVLAGAASQRSLEMKRWRQARQDELHREIRSIAGDLAGSVAEFIHAMLWYTYFVPDAGHPSDDLVRQYKDESHRLIGRIVGTRAKLAAMDHDLSVRLNPFIDRALALSEGIDDATGIISEDSAVDGDKIEALNKEARQLMDDVNKATKALYEETVNETVDPRQRPGFLISIGTGSDQT